MNDGRRAEQLASLVVQPDFQEELQVLGANRFFREMYSSLVRVINSVALTRIALAGGEALARQFQQDAEEATARAKAAEETLEAVRADCANKIREAGSKTEAEADQRRAALDQLSESQSAVEARNLHIADLESALQETKNRAEKAEAELSTKEAERADAMDLLAEKEKALAAAEAAAETKAVEAVEKFKASELFVQEVVEANADFYLRGFEDAKETAARVLSLPQVMGIKPEQVLDKASDDEGAAGS